MALPNTQDAKAHLRIETADEDTLVAQYLARAKATIETYIGYPLIAAAQTYVDYTGRYGYFVQLPGPFALSPAPVVTDMNGSVISTTSYILDQRSGKIRVNAGTYSGASLGTPPFTVVATIGLSAHPDYTTRLEAVAAKAILDFVADMYQNRNPRIGSQAAEAGGSETLIPEAIPPQVMQDLMMLPCTLPLLFA